MKTQKQPKTVVSHKRSGDFWRYTLECGCHGYSKYYEKKHPPLTELECRKCWGVPCLDPECDGIMVEKYNSKSGGRFFGCSGYTTKDCKKSMSYYDYQKAKHTLLTISS